MRKYTRFTFLATILVMAAILLLTACSVQDQPMAASPTQEIPVETEASAVEQVPTPTIEVMPTATSRIPVEALRNATYSGIYDMRGPKPMNTKPDYVVQMEAAYGAPSRNGFGSAVFFERVERSEELEKAALEKYKYFVGELWQRYGEDAWMGPWKEVYARPASAEHDIVAELRGIKDPDAALSVPMILDNIEGAEKARAALSTTFDNSMLTDVRVYNLGDGEAMSGVLVAGRRSNGDATFLVFLLD